MDVNNIVIRKFRGTDRQAIRRIACETSLVKEVGEGLFSNDEILTDALTSYYTDYEPDSCFVATDSGKVIGYVIGSKDVAVMNRTFRKRIVPRFLAKSPGKGIFLDRGNLRFLLNCVSSYFKGEFNIPDFTGEYPATLHINIDKGSRGLNLGTKLVEHYLDFLEGEGIKGIHFGTNSDGAKRFFSRSGFEQLFQKKRTFLKYATGNDFIYCIFGRRL